MSPAVLLLIYCPLVVLASLAGGWIPLLVRLTHTRLQLAVSLVAGMMLGVGLLMLLPHAWMERAEWMALADPHGHGQAIDHSLIDPIIWWLLIGFLAMFFVERLFHFHHHDSPRVSHGHEAHHRDSHGEHSHPHPQRPGVSWAGAAIGLTLHSLMDGLALAASVKAQSVHDGSSLAGLATFLAILLHKPLDSISLGTLLAVQGHTRSTRHIANALFGLAVPIGAALFLLGTGAAADGATMHWILSIALAFSAGTFLCISLSDLLPELQFHQHDRLKLSLALLAGLLLAWLAGLADPHRHGHDDHDHHDHAHETTSLDS